MSDYLDYLEESTNIVKSKNRMSKLILVLSYLVIWAFSLVVFWFFTDRADAMGYAFMFLWVLLPVTTFIISFIVGVHNFWKRWKWLGTVLLGVMYMLAEYATFSTSNMVTFSKWNMPNFSMILTGAIVSFIGMVLGSIVYYLKMLIIRTKKEEKNARKEK